VTWSPGKALLRLLCPLYTDRQTRAPIRLRVTTGFIACADAEVLCLREAQDHTLRWVAASPGCVCERGRLWVRSQILQTSARVSACQQKS